MWVLVFIVLVILGGILLIWYFTRKKHLSPKQKVFFLSKWNHIVSSSSPREGIIYFDALFHKILLEIGYKGTFGEILKRNPPEIPELNLIWKLHKLRNSLAHDFKEISTKDLQDAFITYQREIKKLLERLAK